MFELLVVTGILVLTIVIYCLIQREKKKTLRLDLKIYHEAILTAEKEFQVLCARLGRCLQVPENTKKYKQVKDLCALLDLP